MKIIVRYDILFSNGEEEFDMKDKYTKNASIYYKDIMQIALIVTGVFAVCIVAALIINGFKVWNLLIILVYAVIMVLLIKPIISYVKASKDISSENFISDSIEIDELVFDKTMNLYMKDGLTGDVKYILKTDGGDFFVGEHRAKGSDKLDSKRVLIEHATFDIVYLKDSRLIVDMKPTVAFEEEEITERYNLIFYSLYKQFR